MSIDRLNALLNMSQEEGVSKLKLDELEFLDETPFQIYGGEKKAQLVESIRNNGIISPIVVMPSSNRGRYKILAGANRVDACYILGLEEIEVIIKNDLTEEEAMLIVIESNLFNRSIDDMLPSELAKALYLRQKASKSQGKRTDINGEGTTFGTMCQKLKDEYKLSERNIRNYLRLNYLSYELLTYVDIGKLPFRSGVEISHLKGEEQEVLANLIKEHNCSVSVKTAETLKKLSMESNEIIDIKSIIIGETSKATTTPTSFKVSISDVKMYIPESDLANAKYIILEALKLYYAKNSI